MSEMKHTPGPWTYVLDTCAACEREGTAEFFIAEPPGGYHAQFSHEPDARLIAAAPEQLREMERFLPVLERAEAEPELWARLTSGLGIATLNSYRAAIAKAKGE